MSASKAAARDRAEDRLFAAPFSTFTAVRATLVKELRAAGERDEAVALARAKRPTRSAWALNQIALLHADDLKGFLASAERDRKAQKQAVAARDATAIRDAGRAMNESIARLVALATKVVEADAGKMSPSLARAITGSLRALPFASAEERERVTRGRLVADLQAPDDLALFGAVPGGARPVLHAPAPVKPPAHAPPKRDARAEAEAKRKAKEAEERARAEAERRKHALAKLEKTANEAARDAARLEHAAERARDAARAAEDEAHEARATAERARAAWQRARDA